MLTASTIIRHSSRIIVHENPTNSQGVGICAAGTSCSSCRCYREFQQISRIGILSGATHVVKMWISSVVKVETEV